eukprot:scaffold3329_cov120-Isochrysis_galbana.AAC.13
MGEAHLGAALPDLLRGGQRAACLVRPDLFTVARLSQPGPHDVGLHPRLSDASLARTALAAAREGAAGSYLPDRSALRRLRSRGVRRVAMDLMVCPLCLAAPNCPPHQPRRPRPCTPHKPVRTLDA